MTKKIYICLLWCLGVPLLLWANYPPQLYITSDQMQQQIGVRITSPNAGMLGMGLSDLTDPDSWTDPFYEEPSERHDLDDPESWDDPFYEEPTPIGSTPYLFLLGVALLYGLRVRNRNESL